MKKTNKITYYMMYTFHVNMKDVRQMSIQGFIPHICCMINLNPLIENLYVIVPSTPRGYLWTLGNCIRIQCLGVILLHLSLITGLVSLMIPSAQWNYTSNARRQRRNQRYIIVLLSGVCTDVINKLRLFGNFDNPLCTIVCL